MKVKCPTCGEPGDWLAGPFGPFCSRRCKLVDLGKWFGEEHLISRPIQPRDFEAASEDYPGNPPPSSDADDPSEHR